MGVRTFAEFITNVKRNIGNPDDIDTEIGAWVNDAYLTLTSKNKFYGLRIPKYFVFPELDDTATKRTTDGSPYVIKPSDFLFAYTVFDETNGRKLDFQYPSKYWTYTDRADTTAEGEPTEWIPFSNKLYLYPTPDDTYTLSIPYRKKVSILTGVLTTLVGAEWDKIIEDTATIEGLKHQKQYDEVGFWRESLIIELQEMLGVYDRGERDLDTPMQPDPNYLRFHRK